MTSFWSSLGILAVLLGWAASLFVWMKRFGEQHRALIALATLWLIGMVGVLAGVPVMQDLPPYNVILSLQALAKLVLVGLALALPFGIYASKRFYLLSLRWIILGLIGPYVVLEAINNDLLQRDVIVAYVGVLLGYAFTGVATWKLTRVALTDLADDESRK